MTTRLALLTLAVVAAAARVIVRRLGRLSDGLEAFGRRLQETDAEHDRRAESLDQRLRAAERAATNADEISRSVSRQLVELNRLTVDKAVTLVDVRDDLRKRLPASASLRGHGSSAESNGGTE